MNPNAIKNVVIVGGGTAGWMMAAALSTQFKESGLNIILLESETIGTVGVGESTIPHIRDFNKFLGIDENFFIEQTKATFKLGIVFKNWGNLGDDYVHPFGPLGHDISGIEFHHFWLRMQREGKASSLDDYSLASKAARMGRFTPPEVDGGFLESSYNYAFHFDAALYARYLRKFSEATGVVRVEGILDHVTQDESSGFIKSVILQSGQEINGELFIDCTGFKGVLIDKVLQTPFEDWSRWLLCDKAIAIPCEKPDATVTPYTQATAHKAGWQWRIPLQHRTGNGHVYASQFMSDDEAASILLNNLDGAALAEPKSFTFTAGQRKQNWEKNCVAIGLASGFLEPLESTSIYLIQVGIQKLIEFFPNINFAAENTAEFNRQVNAEYLRIRDFIIMHYRENNRTDSEFWQHCRNMSIPDSLAERQELFSTCGHIDHKQYGVYASVCIGQGMVPKSYDFKVDKFSSADIEKYLSTIRNEILSAANKMPFAQDYIVSLLAKNSASIGKNSHEL